jgi:hypothetical protein
MRLFRNSFVRRTFITIWCLTLFHMTFFMAGAIAFNLTGNRALMENARKLLAVTAAEEETDSHESTERTGSAKMDLIVNNLLHNLRDSLAVQILFKNHTMVGGIQHGHTEKFSPPPDQIS